MESWIILDEAGPTFGSNFQLEDLSANSKKLRTNSLITNGSEAPLSEVPLRR